MRERKRGKEKGYSRKNKQRKKGLRNEHEGRKRTYTYLTVKNGYTELFIVFTLHLHLDSFQFNQTYQLANCLKNFTGRGINDSVQSLHCTESAFLDICISIPKVYYSLFSFSLTKVMRDGQKKSIHWSEHHCFMKGSQLNTSNVFHLP